MGSRGLQWRSDLFYVDTLHLCDKTVVEEYAAGSNMSYFTCGICHKKFMISLFFKIWPCLDEHPYLDIYSKQLCETCIFKREKKYIRSKKKRDLPLIINHRWLSDRSSEFYRERLQKVLI